jgi:hypothetical protein
LNQGSKTERRTGDVNQTIIGSYHVYNSLAHEIQLKLQFIQNISLWVLFDAIGLRENTKDSIEIFEMSEVNTGLWIVDHH